MTSSGSRLVLREVYGTNGLATRQSATAIAKALEALHSSEVEIDFAGIDHTSLAFLDQFLHDARATGKTLSFVNVGEFVQHLFKVLENRRQARPTGTDTASSAR